MRTFEFRDNKSAKFWSIELQGKRFTVQFGKIGTAGQTQIKEFADEGKAKEEYDKLVAEKLKKGYVEVGAAAAPSVPASNPPVLTKSPKGTMGSRAKSASRDAPPPTVSPAPDENQSTTDSTQRVRAAEPSDLEGAWLTSRSSKAAQAFAKHIIDSRGWAAYAGDAVFVEAPLPAALREAVTIQAEIARKIGRCGQGKRLVDILLFRVVPAEPFQRPDLPVAAFDSLYSLLLSLSKVGGIQDELAGYSYSEARRGLPAIAPGDFPFDMDEVRREYEPMEGEKGKFRFRGAMYDAETSARLAEEFFAEIERQRRRRDELLESGIAELRAAGLFGEGDPLFVHWLNDDAHGHGFLPTPWELYVGRTHALVVVREGTWF
jgi:predicted DNA-binding WGR domain protein